MIANEIDYPELFDFSGTLLRLEPAESVWNSCKAILKMPIGTTVGSTTGAVPEHERVRLKYKGYDLDILHFRWFREKGFAIHLHFKAKQKWWHKWFKDQNVEVVADLQKICEHNIPGLSFDKYTYRTTVDQFGIPVEEPAELLYLYDSMAFNPEWKTASDMSPLFIAPDAHHGNCFVEMFFWGGGYMRDSNTTVLRPNWLEFAYDVSRDVEQQAHRLLGLWDEEKQQPKR